MNKVEKGMKKARTRKAEYLDSGTCLQKAYVHVLIQSNPSYYEIPAKEEHLA